MDEGKIVLKASIQGMLSMLMKFVSLLVVVMIVFFRVRKFQQSIMQEYSVGYVSALTQILDTDMELVELGMLLVSYLVSLVLLTAILYSLYHLFSLLFGLSSSTVIDFQQGRIVQKSLRFPFLRIEDENRFHQLIQVRVEQNLIDGILQGGTLYIEYLVESRLDSQLRVLLIPYVKDPDKVKRKLLSY
ncbi:hypothetical protein SAMN05192551_101741 [Tindallia magadiensis]|uniref:DUF304 domain-containing protein n=1 Tax=Tindallia magadiensis TaxID=69895 RepID=A0A1I3BF29_9FIRM|nr:hypothetical protein [Tindallia magadiensis]SFH60331.1 hypothetical protein SAMN05192551_101741 [Tindallia magadiensis]